MTVAISTTILRVRDLVNDHHDWFEAIAAWYDCAKWTKKIFVDYLAARNRTTSRATLFVNDQPAEERFRDLQSPASLPTWWIPAQLLKQGDNLLFLRLEQLSAVPMTIAGVTVDHVPLLSEQTKRDEVPRPNPSAQVAVAINLGGGFRPDADRWNVQVHPKAVQFSLHFADRVPAHFLLGLAVKLPTVGYSLILEDIWDLVVDTIQDKLKKLIKEYYRRLAASDPYASQIEQQIRDLESYLELHQKHLARMLSMSDGATLEEAIELGRKPTPREKYPVLERAEKTPARAEKTATSRGRYDSAAPGPAAGFSMLRLLVKIVVIFLAVGVTAGAVAFSAWYVGLLDLNQLPGLAGLGKGNPPGVVEQNRDLDDRLQAKGAQTGDVQVSLLWYNKNDLDLEVIPPSGEKERLFFGHKNSSCGGKLDVDMNVSYESASAKPVENVFWPRGAAPKGRYQVYVNHFNKHNKPDCQDPTRYSVRVVVHGATQWFHGEVVNNDPRLRRVLVHSFDVR